LDLDRINQIAEQLCVARKWSAPVYIDNGASAAVYKVDTHDGLVALKIYDPSFFEGENALIENKRIELQKELKGHGCPHLIEVLDAGELEENGTWYLLMEFCPWRSLEKRLSDVPNDKVHDLLKQVVQAVQFLESKGLVHRDIKPANIVVSDDFKQLKLLDFGVMRRIAPDEGSGTDGNNFIATAQYSPPEFLTREEIPGALGFSAINIYQIGAVLHDLITKTELFAEEKATRNKFKLFKAITERQPQVANISVAPRLKALCVAALNKDPAMRVSSVKLDDFLADADDLDTLRRRVARGDTGKITPTGPTLAIWQNKVRSWVKEAAQIEAETLGAVMMKPHSLERGQRWQLDFMKATAPIFVDLVPADGGFAVYVLSSQEVSYGTAVFFIGVSGPNMLEADIPGTLAEGYLYALDLAVAAQGLSASEPEALT